MQTISINLLVTLTALPFLLSTEAQTTGRNDRQLLSTEAQTTGRNDRQQLSNRGCRIRAVDPLMHGKIQNKLDKEMLKLIEYKLTFRNYSKNPMTTNVTRYHKADTWSRVSTYQGQILLSLAFNYGVLSLMTLTFGTTTMSVELEDIPSRCIGELPEEEKVELVQQLMMRDFKEDGNMSIVGEGRVCNIEITNQSGYAKFTDYCCYVEMLTQAKNCELNDANKWLRLMWVMLTVVRYGVLLFGPLLFLSTIAKLVNQKIPYVVILEEPLQKTILFSKEDDITKITRIYDVNRRVNLKNYSYNEYPRLIESLCRRYSKQGVVTGSNCELFDGKPFRCFIHEYRIVVNYTRLLVEDEVPVGFWKLILKSVFFCELREVGPFVDCCKQNMCKVCSCIPWIKFWKAIGLCLLVLLLPMPYYLRLLIFYFFEQDEVMTRTEAVTRMELKLSFENSIVHYLLPTHPLLLGIYVIYFTIAVTIVLASKMKNSPFQKIIVGSFDDLQNLSLVGVLHMIVSNVIWPFEELGIFAIFIVFIYWPIVLPITCLVSVCYCIPTIYLTIRMFFYSKTTILERLKPKLKSDPKTGRKPSLSQRWISVFVPKKERSQQLFEIKTFWYLLGFSDHIDNDAKKSNDPENNQCPRNTLKSILVADYEVDRMKNDNPNITDQSSTTTTKTITPTPKKQENGTSKFLEIAVHTCTATFCVVAMYSILIILSECIGCLVEIVVFTIMGVIVNAGALLKYVSLAMLILVYAFDSFNNIEKKYLQLNKALFNIVKGRVKIKKLEEVTGQPSEIQENTGFKSQELSEQGKHEQSDDIAKGMSRYWFINDLILFVDKEDVPRIPKKLFDEVCQIDVTGVPGPVYQGLLSALKSFAKMAIFVMFVFLAILSFGSAYGLSSTTQTIAALAGGSVPLLLKTFVKPPEPDIDTKSVSFTNKLNEVVSNFYQFWPIKDFCFTMQKKKEKEESKGTDAPIVSKNPVVDSVEDVNEMKTVSSIIEEGILMLGKYDSTKTEQNDKKVQPELVKLMRKEQKRTEKLEKVDIVIILPRDFEEHWNEEYTTFITKEHSKRNETTVPTNEYESCETQFRESTTTRPRKTAKFADDVTEIDTEDSVLSNEVAAASAET